MKRIVVLATAAVVAMLILVPSAFAQGTMMKEETMEVTMMQPLPKSGGSPVGGPAVVLPAAAALLLGSGILAYATLRRRR